MVGATIGVDIVSAEDSSSLGIMSAEVVSAQSKSAVLVSESESPSAARNQPEIPCLPAVLRVPRNSFVYYQQENREVRMH